MRQPPLHQASRSVHRLVHGPRIHLPHRRGFGRRNLSRLIDREVSELVKRKASMHLCPAREDLYDKSRTFFSTKYIRPGAVFHSRRRARRRVVTATVTSTLRRPGPSSTIAVAVSPFSFSSVVFVFGTVITISIIVIPVIVAIVVAAVQVGNRC